MNETERSLQWKGIKKIGLKHGPSFLCLVPISLIGLASTYVIVSSPVSGLDHCYPCVINYRLLISLVSDFCFSAKQSFFALCLIIFWICLVNKYCCKKIHTSSYPLSSLPRNAPNDWITSC